MKESTKERVVRQLQDLTKHEHVFLVNRGNSAIRKAIALTHKRVLIPQEGGWIEYKKIANSCAVACKNAVLDLHDLEKKLEQGEFGALLYQNPGGYFAAAPMQEIYALCKRYDCLVILDVSGSIGTEMCDGRFADIIVGSFGRWKLIDVGAGGFISCRDDVLSERINVEEFAKSEFLEELDAKIECLARRIEFLRKRVEKVKDDLGEFTIVNRDDEGFVVVVEYLGDEEKENIIEYCKKNSLEYTQCPRYIRIERAAISIEVKRLRE